MSCPEPDKLFHRGLNALASNDSLSALVYFEKACQLESNPLYSSYYAYCMAKERGQFKKAVALCEEAMEKQANNSIHYLNLGRIYLLQGKKTEAMQIFRQGVSRDANPQLHAELDRLGARKPAVLPFLARGNPINKFLGIILTKLGMR